MKNRAIGRLAAIAAMGFATAAFAAPTVTGAGASFPYPVYAKWASLYQNETGVKVNYQSIGSGGGQQQIIAKTVDFGASDDPMKADKLKQEGLLQFPAVIGGTVPVVNIAGVKAGKLTLSGPVLADIFMGKIKKWNDAPIKQLNPDLNLPSADIVVVHRSDGSGTTFGWTNYLSKVSAGWKSSVGEGKSVKWPVGQGAKGNEGVAAYVKQLANSIGYVEYAYAKQNNLAWTAMQNKNGKVVPPEQKSFAAAASNANWKSAPGMGVVLTDEPGDMSWPVTSATFILVHKVADKPEQTKEVLKFFDWAWKKGGKSAVELDYVPLPDEVTGSVRESWKTEIKDASGAALWK